MKQSGGDEADLERTQVSVRSHRGHSHPHEAVRGGRGRPGAHTGECEVTPGSQSPS